MEILGTVVVDLRPREHISPKFLHLLNPWELISPWHWQIFPLGVKKVLSVPQIISWFMSDKVLGRINLLSDVLAMYTSMD